MYGMQVTFYYKSSAEPRIFHNVTEVHYYMSDLNRLCVAFESDIHSTGINFDIERDVKEFRVEEEVEKHDSFD